MKNLKLVYNPYSGDKTFMYSLDPCVQAFQQCGYQVHLFRSMENGDVDKHIAEMGDGYDAIVVAGGDGTVNQVVNALMAYGKKIPLGIIPAGTANDFGTYLKMPRDHQQAAEVIAYGKRVMIDIGVVTGIAGQRYFINVCGAGLLTNISQSIDSDFKETLGKLAYYIKGIGQIPSFVPMPVRITTSKQVMEESVYFFIVLNSAGTGGFEKLSPNASINDGLLDFIAFRAMPIMDLAVLFVKVLAGDYLGDSNIIFFRDHYFNIVNLAPADNPVFYETDIDGERGPDMPIEIKVLPEALEIFVPSWETQ